MLLPDGLLMIWISHPGMLAVTIEALRQFQRWQNNAEKLHRITKNFGNLKKNFKNMRERR